VVGVRSTDGSTVALTVVAAYSIRIYGDPVLRQRCSDVTDIDGALVRLVDGMADAMHEVHGLGLAAPQVGVQKRLFVYDLDDGAGPQTLINPTITEYRDEWQFEEGCLSVPGLFFPIVRPKEIHLTGFDLDGNEVSIEADEIVARLFQHELDHLDGKLLFEYLDDAQRKAALKSLRQRNLIPQDLT
jgi:peptide deformylase